MFILSLTYTKPIELIDKLRPAHLEFLKQYYEKGIFVLSGRKTPLTGGIIMAKDTTRAELEEIIKQDPFYTEQVATFEIIEFSPNLTASGLEHFIGH